jgi:hypothetical protein
MTCCDCKCVAAVLWFHVVTIGRYRREFGLCGPCELQRRGAL